RPQTLGQNKFNINVSYQYVKFDSINGEDLDNLHGSGPIVLRNVDSAGNLIGFEADRLRYNMGLRNHVAAFSFTYGILDNLDANLLLPLIETALDVDVRKQQVFTAGPDEVFQPNSLPPVSGSTSGHKFGPGDLLLRLKYQLPRADWFRSAFGLQFRFPTGNEDNFQGTGDWWITPAFYASTLLWDRVEPFANAAIDFNMTSSRLSQARYGAGVDVDVISRLGLVVAFLGRSQLDDPFTAGETDFLAPQTTGGVAREPLLGITLDRADFFDFSFGVRGVIWGNIMMFANGIVALNDDGLRNDSVIPTVGFEGTF